MNIFTYSMVLLIKMLRLLIYCKKKFLFPFTAATQGLLVQESQIWFIYRMLSVLFLVKAEKSRPLPRNGLLHAPRAGLSGLTYQSKLKNESPYA